MKEITNEKAIYDKGDAIPKDGISKSSVFKPRNRKDPTVNSFKIKSTKNKVIALVRNLKTPKVKRLRGRSKIFIAGRTKNAAVPRERPASMRLCHPFSNTSPLVIVETKYKARISTKNTLNILFISFHYCIVLTWHQTCLYTN